MSAGAPQSAAVAVVPLEGRGTLPFVDLHQEALFLHAVRALLDVDRVEGRVVVTVDPEQHAGAVAALERHGLDAGVAEVGTWWGSGSRPATVLLHDPLCPLVPAAFLDRCLQVAQDDAHADVRRPRPRAVVAYRPVTDTIKTVVDSQITGTLDRDLFGIVTSPVAFAPGGPGARRSRSRTPQQPAGTKATASAGMPPTRDFGALATWVRGRGPADLVKAPSLGRRVDDASAVNLLECIDELAARVRER